MSILISILVALSAFLGYHVAPATNNGPSSGSPRSAPEGPFRARPQSGSGPVGCVMPSDRGRAAAADRTA